VGCVVDGCPAGLSLSLNDIMADLARRRPGNGGAFSTTRQEADEAEILSGLFEGRTLGTPIAIIVRNTNQHSADYEALKDTYRPGHADYAWDAKFGFRDYRGGGRASARETVGRVAAGAVARKLLAKYGVSVSASTPVLDEALAENLRSAGDSIGGIVEARVTGMKAGLGEPVFDKLDGRIALALMSIPAVKGVEIGAGFAAASMQGSEDNDSMRVADGRVTFLSNNAGGMTGGISTGQDIVVRAAFKPVPSIGREQETVRRNPETGCLEDALLAFKGRHDVSVCVRAVPVVEAMLCLVLADFMLLARADKT
jgi:chorismate synthase